jgi:hypothetical protein
VTSYDDRVATRLAETLDAAIVVDTLAAQLHVDAVRTTLLARGDIARGDVLRAIAEHRPALLLDELDRLDGLEVGDLDRIDDHTLATAISAHLSRSPADRHHLSPPVWRTLVDAGGELVATTVLGAYDGGIDDVVVRRAVGRADLDALRVEDHLGGRRLARFAADTPAGQRCRDRAMSGTYGEVTTEVGLGPDDIATWVHQRLPGLVAAGDPVTDGIVDHLGGVAPWVVAPALAAISDRFMQRCEPNTDLAQLLLDDFGVGSGRAAAEMLWCDAGGDDPSGHQRVVTHLEHIPADHGVADWGVAGHAAELLAANPAVSDPHVVAAINSHRGHRYGVWCGLGARAGTTGISAAVLSAAVAHRAPTRLLGQLIAACDDGADVALRASAGDVAMTYVVDALVDTGQWDAAHAAHLHVDLLRYDDAAAVAVDDALQLLADTIGSSATRARLFDELGDYDGTVGELCATLSAVD